MEMSVLDVTDLELRRDGKGDGHALAHEAVDIQHIRIDQPVLVLTLGTEMHRFQGERRDWLGGLDLISRSSIAHRSIDTANLMALFRLPRHETLQIAVPRDLDLVLRDPDRFPDLAHALMPGYRPLTTDDGGTMPRNDACIALFDQVPSVRSLIRSGLTEALAVPRTGYTPSGLQPMASVYLIGFPGGTTQSGTVPFVVPLLRAEADALRTNLWISIHLTLPDHALGEGENEHRRRLANSMACILELLAVKEARPLQLPIGAEVVAPKDTAPLYDELVLYSAKSRAGTVSANDQTRILQGTVRMLAENGHGIGQQVKLNRIRQRHLLNGPAPGTEHPGTIAAYSFAEIRFDRRLLAQAFAKRSALDYMRLVLRAPAPKENLFQRLAGGDVAAWLSKLQEWLGQNVPPITVNTAGLGPADIPRIQSLKEVPERQWEYHRAQLRKKGPELMGGLSGQLGSLVFQAMGGGAASLVPQLADTAQRLGILAHELQQQADTAHRQAETRRDEALANLLDTRRRRDDETLMVQLSAWAEAKTAYYAACRQLEMARILAAAFRRAQTQLEHWGGQLDQTLTALWAQLAPGGPYERRVKHHPVWSGDLGELPCERFLLEPTESEALYQRLQPLFRPNAAGQPAVNMSAFHQTNTTVSNRFGPRMLGKLEPEDLFRAVETYFSEFYTKALADYSLTGVIRTLHGEVLEPLREKVRWAFETAQPYISWLDIGSLTRHLHTHLVVELGDNDPDLAKMIRESADADPIVITADRGDLESIIVFRSVYGLHLDLLPAFREGGTYWQAYVETQRTWLNGHGTPVHTNREMEERVMRTFPKLAKAVSWHDPDGGNGSGS